MHCQNCHAAVDQDARFCAKCGAAVNASEPASRSTGQRRHLTIMFSDLVDSTKLAAQLDAEDVHEILRLHQETCGRLIREYGGHVAQHLGDGLLVYFGYPRAHEDDSQRAARAGLAIVDAVAAQNSEIQARFGVELQIRIGIHAGPTVVGQTGSGEDETLAFGNTSNLAARFMSEAKPGQVVIGSDVRQLLADAFELEPIGSRQLKGVAEPVALFQVIRSAGIDRRVRTETRALATPLVGRDLEVEQIAAAFERAMGGYGRGVLVRGDAGIGKSRLVAELHGRFSARGVSWLESRGISYRADAAFHPVAELMELALGLSSGRDLADTEKLIAAIRAVALSPDVLPLLASILGLPLPDEMTQILREPSAQRAALVDALSRWISALASERPLVLVIEDLHWVDPSTLELLEAILSASNDKVFLLLTARPSFSIGSDETGRLTIVELGPVNEDGVSAIAQAIAGDAVLPDEVISLVVERTDGTPLFVEELVRDLIESGVLQQEGERWTVAGSLTDRRIPATLEGTLRSRIDRLGPEQELLQYASILGREFRIDVLAAFAAGRGVQISAELETLENAGFLHPVSNGESRAFHHALIRDAVYEGMLRRTRRELHGRAGETLSEGFAQLAEGEPDVVAHHFAQAEDATRAALWFGRAGEQASARAALTEAEHLFLEALLWLERDEPSREGDESELRIRVTLGEAQVRLYGYGSNEIQRVFGRIHELCDALDETPPMVLWSQFAFANSRSDRNTVERLAAKAEILLSQVDDPDVLEMFHTVLATNSFYAGNYGETRRYIESSWRIRESRSTEPALRTQEMRSGIDGIQAVTEWVTGFAVTARATIDRTVRDAEAFGSPYVLAAALEYATSYEINEGDPQQALVLSERQRELSRQQHFDMRFATATAKRGWARSALGEADVGISEIQDALEMNTKSGHVLGNVYLRSLLVGALLASKRISEARAAHQETMTLCAEGIECGLLPGLLVLGAELDRIEVNLEGAEENARSAIEVAQEQEALTLELRAGMSLATTMAATDRTNEAVSLLNGITERFPTGQGSRTLKHASFMLNRLQGR